MINRIDTRKVLVRDIQIGGNNKVVIQSMITHKPRNIEECVNEILELEKVGSQIVRMTVMTVEDAKAIEVIKSRKGYKSIWIYNLLNSNLCNIVLCFVPILLFVVHKHNISIHLNSHSRNLHTIYHVTQYIYLLLLIVVL